MSEMKLILFTIEKQLFGLSIRDIARVTQAVTLKKIPTQSPIIAGIANVHGELIPVLNTRVLFNLPPREIALYDNFIQLNAGQAAFMLVVDAVLFIHEYTQDDYIPAQQFCPEQIHYIDEVVKQEGEIVFVLNAHKIATDILGKWSS